MEAAIVQKPPAHRCPSGNERQAKPRHRRAEHGKVGTACTTELTTFQRDPVRGTGEASISRPGPLDLIASTRRAGYLRGPNGVDRRGQWPAASTTYSTASVLIDAGGAKDWCASPPATLPIAATWPVAGS